jgi:PAS domain S-box-containing protein
MIPLLALKDFFLNLRRINDINLKWKLIITLLFLTAVGAATLFLVSYRFQASLINLNEDRRLRNLYQAFLNDINTKKEMAMSLASLTARNPQVAAALAFRDRSRLIALLSPAYKTLERDFGVRQFHFHIPPATSFLRLHAPGQHGENMETYRPTINQARKTGLGVGGIERGTLGLSIRSVVPVFHQGRQAGTVEFGLSLGKPLLEEFKKKYTAEVGLYLPGDSSRETPRIFDATLDQPPPPPKLFQALLRSGEMLIQPEIVGTRKVTTIIGPVRDFSGKIIGLVKISVDRSPALALLHRYTLVAAAIGLGGLIVSIAFVWFISFIFTRRIDEVIKGADEIASGRRDTRLPVKSGDELDVMARAINQMLRSLDASQLRLKEYAQNLELMVEQRTRSLRDSEKTYRTLVENVPLIVYMIEPDGKTLFLNRASEQLIGIPPEELNGPYENWAKHIHPDDRDRILTQRWDSLQGKQELHTDYRLVHPDKTIIYCFDHAVPVFTEDGEFYRMDGIIIDVTAQKELQEKNLQTQELETLSQISSRLAHELRNPLTSIGGLARRIVKSFRTADDRAEKSQMILEQVQKLEKILNMMLAFISPQAVSLKPVHLNNLILQVIEELHKKFQPSPFLVNIKLDPDLKLIPLDENLFEKALMNLMENAWDRMGRKGEIELVTIENEENATLILTYQVLNISMEDIDHYFYPFTVDYSSREEHYDSSPPDVSISKVIIHKHGGVITVTQEADHRLKLTLTLPLQ